MLCAQYNKANDRVNKYADKARKNLSAESCSTEFPDTM